MDRPEHSAAVPGPAPEPAPAQGGRRRRLWTVVVLLAVLALLAPVGVALLDSERGGKGSDAVGLPSASPGPAAATSSATPTIDALPGDTPAPSASTTPATPPVPGGTTTAAAPAPGLPDPRLSQLVPVLDRRADAVVAKDRAGWMSVVDPTPGPFRKRQATAFAGLRTLPIAAWSYTVRGVGPTLSAEQSARFGERAWIAHVELRYRLAGYDTAEMRRDLYLTVVPGAGGWLLGGDEEAAAHGMQTARDIWDLGRISVVEGRRAMVIGRRDAEQLRGYVADADEAVRRVTKVWGTGWERRVVVLVPDTQEEMRRLSGSAEDGLDQIAAVTTGQLEAGERAAADRVIVNPATYGTLAELGRIVVMTHEVTHVATRLYSRDWTPMWLSEGFADYVAYKGSGVPVRVAAQDVLAQVRQGDGPRRLPGRDDFDATKGEIAPSYEGAWLACRLLARTYGEKALVRFYQAAGGAVGLADDAAMRAAWSELGTTQREFVAAWRDALVEAA